MTKNLMSPSGQESKKFLFRGLLHSDRLLFAVLLLLSLLPVWSFEYFPSQDGPTHLENAKIIRDYFQPNSTLLREYYLISQKPVPYWFVHTVMAGLMTVFHPLMAEKILLTAYVVLLPLSVRYALMAVNPASAFLSVLIFPMLYNSLFHMGFYNFSFSLFMYFFALGYWIRHQDEFKFQHGIGLFFLMSLVYFTHIFSLFAAWVVMAGMTACFLLINYARRNDCEISDKQDLWRRFRSRILATLAAVLSPLVWVIPFLQTREWVFSDGPAWHHRFNYLASFTTLISFSRSEMIFSTTVAALFAAIALFVLIWKILKRDLNEKDGILLASFIYGGFYFFGPNRLENHSFIIDRFAIFIFLSALLWFGANASCLNNVRLWIQAAGVFLTVSFLTLHSVKYSELNDYLEEYLSGRDHIRENSTLLPLSYADQGYDARGDKIAYRIYPFSQAAGFMAAEKNIVDLSNFEAGTTSKDTFPTLFRDALNPWSQIGNIGGDPPCVNFLDYSQKTGGRVDYVLLWGMREDDKGHPCTVSVLGQLGQAYDPVFESPKRGLLRLYRHKDLA